MDIMLDNQQQYSSYANTLFSYLNFCGTTIILVKNKKYFTENL